MKRILFVASALILALCASAADAPRVKLLTTPGQAIVNKISDNGEWAVGVNTNSETTDGVGGILIKISDLSWVEVIGNESETDRGDVRDVTDDGEIVVGSHNGVPAYWTRSTESWTALQMPSAAMSAIAVAVTPDGKFAVGETVLGEYERGNALWDLSTGKLVATPGLPVLDMQHEDNGQNSFVDISADGRYILARLSFSYIMPPGLCSYIYDRETATYDFIGFTPSDTAPWTPKVSGLYYVDDVRMSPNGKYVTGLSYMVKDTAAGTDEYDNSFIYNRETKEFTLFDKASDQGITGYAVTNDGTIYGSAPSSTPIRDWYVRNGKYWYPITDIFAQHYGKNIYELVNAQNSGTPIAISGDGRVIGVFTDPRGEGYIMNVYEDLLNACADVDLLGNYTVSPLGGSSFSAITEVKVSFDRNIDVVSLPSAAYIEDASGAKVRSSMGMTANASTLTITFRPTTMNVGETYTVVVPAGSVSISGDQQVTNREIRVSYTGRSTDAVQLVKAYPADGASISKLDYYTSQILLTFDTNVAFTGNEEAWLYRENESMPYAAMLMSAQGSNVVLYPASAELLYDGVHYRVVMAAGSVTDVGGNGPNAQIELNYVGSYIREISPDDKYIFKDDFSAGAANFMFYEGDNNVPTEEMKALGFTQSETAWYFGRDDEASSDIFMMSHSCYDPAGQSDDWMVTPQIFIPDEICRLTFDSQSYRKNKQDRLKVYAVPSDSKYYYMSEIAVADFLANRVLIYDELQSPGATEGITAGEWTHNDVSLAQFAGKSIYLAFVNDNTDQSVVFVDNVVVIRDMRYLVTVDVPTSVVDYSSIDIKGRITVDAEAANYSTLAMKLIDNDGKTVSTISDSGLSLKKGDTYQFAFSKPLPLVSGKLNNYKIEVTLDDESTTIDRSIKDLAFNVTRKVVIEEYSGSSCGNCPGGILAIDNIVTTFGSNIIPIAIRTYGGDNLSMGLNDYAAFLGLTQVGAPSCMINRTGGISTRYFANENGAYSYSSSNPEEPTWLDQTVAQLSTPADGEVSIEVSYDEDTNAITVPTTVRYALDAENLNIGLFLVITEDQVEAAYQDNYFYNSTDPILGEWGAGGIYGTKRVRGVKIDDVARAVSGLSYNGTVGLVPAKMEGGESYTTTLSAALPANMDDINNLKVAVLMIDCNTDQIINACQSTVIPSGIDDAIIPAKALSVKAEGDAVKAVCADDADITVQLVTVAGRLLGTATGKGEATVSANGYRGIAIVRAATATAVKTAKVVIR